jgi:hypothetical protein
VLNLRIVYLSDFQKEKKRRKNDLVSGLFSSLDIGTKNLPTYRPLHTFMGSFGSAQMPQNSIKKLFSGCFGLFLLKKWAY